MTENELRAAFSAPSEDLANLRAHILSMLEHSAAVTSANAQSGIVSDEYARGVCNGLAYARSLIGNEIDAQGRYMRGQGKVYRVALADSETKPVRTLREADLRELCNGKQPHAWLAGEYVEYGSPHATWEAIRAHGYSCRAFREVRMR